MRPGEHGNDAASMTGIFWDLLFAMSPFPRRCRISQFSITSSQMHGTSFPPVTSKILARILIGCCLMVESDRLRRDTL